MFIRNNQATCKDFISFVTDKICAIEYKCTDLLILPSSEYIEEFKRKLLQRVNKPVLLLPRITTLYTLHNSQIELLDFCNDFSPIDQTIINDATLAKLISQSFCDVGLSLNFLTNYTDFLKKFLEHSPAFASDTFNNLLTCLRRAIGARNPIFQLTENLFNSFERHNLLPLALAQKNILSRLAESFSSGCNKLFLVEPIVNSSKLIEDFFATMANHPNCFIFKDEATPSQSQLSARRNTYIECDNEVDQRYITYFIIRELIENNAKNIVVICSSTTQEQYITALLNKYGIPSLREQTLAEHSYCEFFIKIFQVFTSEKLSAIELAAIIKHQCSKFLDSPAATTLEKSYLRKPSSWRTLEELLQLIREEDGEVEDLLNELIRVSQLLKGYTFKSLLANHLQVFKAWCKPNSDYIDLENFINDIGVIESDFTITSDEYFELISHQLKSTKLAKEPQPTTVKFLSLEKALNIDADAYIVTDFNEGTYPPNIGKAILIGEKAETALGIPNQKAKQDNFARNIEMLLTKNVYLLRPKSAGGADQISSRFIDLANANKEKKYNDWFNDLYFNNHDFTPITSPAPNPEISLRPREISLSGIEKLIRNPYAYYAEYILKLRKADEIGVEVKNREFGIAIHSVLAAIHSKDHTSESYMDDFLKLFKRLFNYTHPTIQTLFEERAKNIAFYLYEHENKRIDVSKSIPEVEGSIEICGTKVKARADKINLLFDNNLEIIDYKTGIVPSKSEILEGKYPQLAVEALIAEQGGFACKPNKVKILYLPLKGRKEMLESKEFELDSKITEEGLNHLIQYFLRNKNKFYVSGNIEDSKKVEAYEHLARRDEWEAE